MGIFKKLISILQTVVKRKVLLYTLLGGVGVLIVALYFIPQKKEEEVKPAPVTQVSYNLVIDVPKESFPYKKEFDVRKLSDAEIRDLESRLPGFNVVNGEAYEVNPKDGRDEFARVPFTVRIYVPADYIYGEDYTGLAVAYVPKDNPNVYYPFPGSAIGKDDKGYYVEAKVFHTSIIAAISIPAERSYHSLKLVREVASSVKSPVIIVPGEDPSFSGGFDETTNFWVSIFPDRTIYVYDYPLTKARSMRYEKEARDFFKKEGIESYALFEAENLASLLKDPIFAKNDYVIIAHGIGGIIARLALERHPEIKNVKKLVLVSTPSKGTAIANPMVFASLIYENPPKVVSDSFGIPEDLVLTVKTHIFTYIEKVNVFYKDVLPNSSVLKMLKPRNDVEYLVISGTTPPMKIDLSGSDLEKYYPELVKGKGDGVVNVESAKIEGKPFLTFDMSFSDYSKAEVLEAIRSFVETEKIPKPPEFKTDIFKEFGIREKEVEEEKAATKVQVKEVATETGFLEPEGYVLRDILRPVARKKISSYDSGACLNDKPYFATGEGLETWNYVEQRGTFRFLKNVGGELTMICGNGRCKVNVIGFSKMEGEIKLESDVEDVLVNNDGDVFAVIPGEGGTEKLVIYTEGGYRVIYEAPGVRGKLIPREDGFIFLTDSIIAFFDFKGKLQKVITMDSIAVEGHRAAAVYALEKKDLLFVLTEDNYLLVHDEKRKKSWIVGEGNIADGFKIIDIGRYLVVLGKRVAFFVDTEDRKIKGCYQVFKFEIKDAFACEGDVYLVTDSNGKTEVRVYKPVGLNLPCGNW